MLMLKKWCLRLLWAPFFAMMAYAAAALLLAVWPVQESLPETGLPGSHTVYLASNGVHLNLVLPASDLHAAWQARLPEHLPLQGWAYIGWGSHTFYTEVAEWRDLTVAHAMRALWWDDSLIYLANGPAPQTLPAARVRRLQLGGDQYRRLLADIHRQFANHRALPDKPQFYPAQQHYQPLQTCNEWVRRRLYHAGVRVPAWAPFDRPLLWYGEALPHP